MDWLLGEAVGTAVKCTTPLLPRETSLRRKKETKTGKGQETGRSEEGVRATKRRRKGE